MSSRYEIHIPFGGPGGGPPPPSSLDRFAPKYLVGNVPAGDSAVAYSADGFVYIPDPGDGTGIEAALTAAAADPGDVWLRPGTYDYGAGDLTGALTVPVACRLRGAGPSTIIQTRAGDNQGAFILLQGAEVADMALGAPARTGLAGTERGLIMVTADQTFVRRVSLNLSPDVSGALRYAISIAAGSGGTLRRVRLEDITCDLQTRTSQTNDPSGMIEVTPKSGVVIISFSNLRSSGGDVSVYDPSVPGDGIMQLIGDQLTLDEWHFAAIRWNGVGQISRLSMTASNPDGTAQAVNIASRPAVPSTVLRDVWLDPKGSLVVGVVFTADVNGGVGLAPVLDGLTYSGAASIFVLCGIASAAARGARFQRISALQNLNGIGVSIQANNPDTVVEGCTIAMLGTSGRIGISTGSTRTRVKNNTVSMLASGAGGVGTAVLCAAGATESVVSENNIITANVADVGVDMVGNDNGNAVGNILDMTTDANAFVNVPATCNVSQNVIV